MKKRNFIQAIGLMLCLLLGLTAPFLSTFIQDHQGSASRSFDGESHYTYQGTLLNHVLAFSAQLNSSPALEEISREEGSYSDAAALWSDLCSFLPLSGEYDLSCEHITLAPKQYNAQYRYVSLTYQQDGAALNAVVDEQSSLPIRIELKCAPDVMTAFIEQNSTWDLIRRYTELLGLGEPADVYYSASTVLVSRSAPIRGAPYTAEMTVMPSGGVLLLKLTAVSE